MLPDLASTDTTAGACAICARRTPRGMGLLRAGAVIFGVGTAGAILFWQLQMSAAVSAACLGAGVLFGLPFLGVGVRRVLGPPAPFATCELMVHGGAVAVPGQALEAIVRIGPDHLLYVQSATVELVALELDAQGNPRVLDVVSVPFAPGVRLEGPVEERVLLRVPSPWPLTMKSPDITGVARHPVETRLRLSIDVAAHPLLEREAEVVISAPA